MPSAHTGKANKPAQQSSNALPAPGEPGEAASTEQYGKNHRNPARPDPGNPGVLGADGLADSGIQQATLTGQGAAPLPLVKPKENNEQVDLGRNRLPSGSRDDGNSRPTDRPGDGDRLAASVEAVGETNQANSGAGGDATRGGNSGGDRLGLPEPESAKLGYASRQAVGAGEQVSRQTASVRTPLPSSAFSGNLPLTREQSNPLKTLPDNLLTREHAKAEEIWLKSLLPSLLHGWWDVAANGKGFVIKQRWRNKGQQTQPYPRVSREQFLTLKEKDIEDAKIILEDRITGHIEDCLNDPKRRTRAGCAAERLGLKH